MNKNKILVQLEIPMLEKKIDLFIPINKKIGTIKSLIEKALVDMSGHSSVVSDKSNIYNKATGEIYNVNESVKNTDLENGSKIVLI